MSIDQIKAIIRKGYWTSLAPELRPSASRSVGAMQPYYLTRNFKYFDGDEFELVVTTFAEPYGKIGLARMNIRGTVIWRGEHPIAPGAQKVDFAADRQYNLTPLHQGFADTLNKVASATYEPWTVNSQQSILKKSFAPFGLAGDQVFAECDLIYLANGLMFWGARHIDGRPFDSDANRPTNLQIPLQQIF